MFPFSIKGNKIKTGDTSEPKVFAENLARQINARHTVEADVIGNRIELSARSELGPLGNLRMRSAVGFLSSCTLEIKKPKAFIEIHYTISFLALFSLSFIFLPFIIISFLDVSPSLKISPEMPLFCMAYFIGGGYLISLIHHIAFIRSL